MRSSWPCCAPLRKISSSTKISVCESAISVTGQLLSARLPGKAPTSSARVSKGEHWRSMAVSESELDDESGGGHAPSLSWPSRRACRRACRRTPLMSCVWGGVRWGLL